LCLTSNVLTSCSTQSYKVIEEEQDYYHLEGLKDSYSVGETVSFSVKINDGVAKLVNRVTTNVVGTNISENDDIYSFSMPNQDATIIVSLLDANKYDGDGNEETPVTITNKYQLAQFRDDYNEGEYSNIYCYVNIEADIDLNGEEWVPIGDYSNSFQGVVEGNNHTISNFTLGSIESNLTSNTASFYGLFGMMGYSEVYDLNLSSINALLEVKGKGNYVYIGGLAGYAYNSYFENVDVSFTSLNVSSLQNGSAITTIGGLVGEFNGIASDEYSYVVSINGCSSSGDVVFSDSEAADEVVNYSGGLVGVISTGTFENIAQISSCYHKGSIIGKTNAGGLIGYTGIYTGITNCFASGDKVEATGTDGSYAGGLVAQAYYENASYECFSFYNTISAPASTSTYYKSYAGLIYGYASADDYDSYELIGAHAYSCLAKEATVSADNINNEDTTKLTSEIDIAKELNFSENIWDLTSLTITNPNFDYDISVKIYDGDTLKETISGESNTFDSKLASKLVNYTGSKKSGYSYFGLGFYTDLEANYRFYLPLSHDISLFTQYASVDKLVGSYSVKATYYENSFSSGTFVISEDSFTWILEDNCVSYYSFTFDGEHIFINDYTGEDVLEGNLGGYSDTIFSFDEEDLTISGYDVNSDDCTYLASKLDSEVSVPNYSSSNISGVWYTADNKSVYLFNDGNYYGTYTSSSSGNSITSVGGYILNSDNSIEIGYTNNVLSKTSGKYDSNYGIIYSSSGVILAKESIGNIYSSEDKSVSITLVGDKYYLINSGSISLFNEEIKDGSTISIGSDTYLVSGTTLVKEVKESLPASLLGEWTGTVGVNSLTLILNEDYTGSYNGTDITFEYKNNTISFVFGEYTATLTFDESNLKLTGNAVDEYEEFNLDISLTKKKEEESTTKGYYGTWCGTVGSNENMELILNSDGTGSYNGTSFTYTESNGTISFNVADMTATLVFNETHKTLNGSFVDDYEGFNFEASFTLSSSESEKGEGNTYKFIGSFSGKVGFNTTTITFNEDGSGTYGETSFTWTYESGTITCTASTGYFTLTCTYNESSDSISLSYEDEDYNEFSGTLNRV